jgi:hypothetical protein
MTAQIITANRLDTGTPVYLNQLFDWSSEIRAARVLTDNSEIEDVLKIIERARISRDVVGVYAVDVAPQDGVDVPVQLRFHEQVRVNGHAITPAQCPGAEAA